MIDELHRVVFLAEGGVLDTADIISVVQGDASREAKANLVEVVTSLPEGGAIKTRGDEVYIIKKTTLTREIYEKWANLATGAVPRWHSAGMEEGNPCIWIQPDFVGGKQWYCLALKPEQVSDRAFWVGR